MRTPSRFLALVAAVCLPALCGAQGAAAPGRPMLFLSRDAVVRGSAQQSAWLEPGGAGPGIVAGVDAGGTPREKFETAQIAKAAALLAKYLERITSARCEVLSAEAGAAAPGRRVFIGDAQGKQTESFPELAQADAHGFVIATKGADLHIVGRSGTGSLYGVWFFLQNYCGLRVLMPGELGEVHPRKSAVFLARDLYVLNPGPDFLLRIHSGTGTLDRSAWLGDFAGTERFQYHHNTPAIYDPVRFGKEHPEWYPIYKGSRYIPNRRVSGWEPNFSEGSVAKRAVEYAGEQFTANPALLSISVTPNDDHSWSEIDLAAAKKRGVEMKDVYFDYVNQVAREVAKNWPGRNVAFLLDYHFSEPPREPMEPNVIGFIMDQRGDIRDDLARWGPTVRQFGCYQWLYGAAYPFPNHYPHAMRDFLQLLRRHGARAFKSEFYDVPINGSPRLWVIANLLWNTEADVDALLDDYIGHMYGREATPAMKRYWAQWERVYERRRTEAEFNLTDRKGGEAKLADITDADIEACGQALKEAAAAATGEENRLRVEMTAAAFGRAARYYELCKRLKPLREFATKPEFTAPGQAEALLKTAGALLEAEEAVYDWNVRRIEPEPFVEYCAAPARGKNPWPWKPFYLSMDPRILYITSRDKDWVAMDATVDRIAREVTAQRLGGAPAETVAEYWRKAADEQPMLRAYAESERLRLLPGRAKPGNETHNGSFEIAGDPESPEARQLVEDMRSNKINWNDCDKCTVTKAVCEGWNAFANREVKPIRVELDPEVKKEGKVSVRIEYVGANIGGVAGRVVLPDAHARYRLSFWYRTRGETQAMCYYMFYRTRHLPYGSAVQPASAEWRKVEIEFPFNHTLLPLETTEMSLCLGSWAGTEGSAVWFDDVRIERLALAERKP